MDISYLLALQEFRDGAGSFLADFFLKMTFLGELNTVIIILAIIYWAVNKDFGTYLLMGWSGSRIVNGFLIACFIRLFYVAFCFPCLMKVLDKSVNNSN